MPEAVAREEIWQALRDYRAGEAARVAEQLAERRFVGLQGEAGVGKSMVLRRAVYTGRAGVGFVDLDGAWGVGQTAWLFFHAAAEAVAGPVALSHLAALDEGLMPASSRRAGFALHNLLGSDIANEVLSGSTLPDDVALLGQAVEVFAELSDVLLVIDHLEAPGRSPRHPLDIEQLLWELRSVHQHNPSMRLCVCGRSQVIEQARGRTAAFYRDGIWLTIRVPAAEVWNYVGKTAWPTMDDVAIERRVAAILKLTDGQPASMIALIAQDVRLTPLDAEERAAEEFSGTAQAAIEHARSLHRLGAHLLLEVAQGQGPYAAVPGGGTDVTRALRALRKAGLLTKAGRGDWRLTEPLLGAALLAPWRDATQTSRHQTE
jgi:hypothetical protein